MRESEQAVTLTCDHCGTELVWRGQVMPVDWVTLRTTTGGIYSLTVICERHADMFGRPNMARLVPIEEDIIL